MPNPIYDIDYSVQVDNLLPVNKRLPKYLAWVRSLVKPIQWLHDNFFNDFANGGIIYSLQYWASNTAYAIDVKIIDGDDHGVYQATVAISASFLNLHPRNDLARWVKVADDFRGVNKRIKYTGQKLFLEWSLNEWFRTTFRQPDNVTVPDIYITNNALAIAEFIFAQTPDMASNFGQSPITIQNYFIDALNVFAYDFTIFIPTAVWNALAATDAARDAIVRVFANKYVISGMRYDIQQY
jgi:hypothetical protein